MSAKLVAVDFLPSDVLRQQLMLVSTMFAKGQLNALPMAGYGMKSVVAAMRLLAQASHVGKVRQMKEMWQSQTFERHALSCSSLRL